MTSRHFSSQSSIRIFGFAALLSLAVFLFIGVASGIESLFAVLTLAVIEVTFSFENAVVNASVLGKMKPIWQLVFLTAGIAVAVFGVRVLLPLALVSITAHLGMGTVLSLALHHPSDYAQHLEDAHQLISAFGASFLLMVFLQFLFAPSEVHWWKRLEHPLRKLETPWVGPLILATLALCVAAASFAGDNVRSVLLSGFIGIAVYSGIKLLGDMFQNNGSQKAIHAGLFGFLYLELLDASFSFDGVVAAFAITQNVVLIAAGLGVGALYVRSLTVYLLRKGTMARYVYLEHGAYYAVGALSMVLLLNIGYNVPSFITGAVGVGIIGLALQHSRRYNRRVLK